MINTLSTLPMGTMSTVTKSILTLSCDFFLFLDAGSPAVQAL